jgi:hypothetical protein
MIRQIALVSEAPKIGLSDLAVVAAAIQRQVTNDVGPMWGIQATVDCFPTLQSIPLGYWPIILKANLPPSAGDGIHEDKAGQPFALVRPNQNWKVSVSHETIEILVDPFGQRTVPGLSPKPSQGQVDFLVEICDPCQAVGYSINGVPVSDFCTPDYYDLNPAPGVRYSFTGAITAPRQVLPNGYLTWHDPVTSHWFRRSFFGPTARIIDMGPLTQTPAMNFRSLVYAKTPEAFKARESKVRLARPFKLAMNSVDDSMAARAVNLQQEIDDIISQAKAAKPRRKGR